MQSAAGTHVGHVRGRNEDAYLHRPERHLFVVADGMGGHPAGDVASRIAVETLDERLDDEVLADDPGGALSNAMRSAHEAINAHIEQEPSTAGMGTTVVAAYVEDGRAVLASVGDSRIYQLRDGSLRQVTHDDVWEGSFGRSLSQALGGQGTIDTEIVELEFHPDDRLLLCSDGLTDMVDDQLIGEVLGADRTPEQVVDRLISCALDHGGYDNITLIVVDAPEN